LSFFSLILPVVIQANFDVSPYNANKVSDSEKNWFILNGKPGQKLTDSFRITNTSTEVIYTKFEAKDSKILEDGSFTIIAENEKNQNAGTWLNLDINTIAIEPKKSSQIPFSITIPKDAKDGEYAAGIAVYETEPDNNNIKVIVRKGLRTYVAVGQDFKLDTEVSNLNIMDPKDANFQEIKDKKGYFGKNNLLIEFEGENTGNIFGLLEAKYAIKFANGQVFENTFTAEIAPGVGKRTYYIVTNQAYQPGDTEVILDYKVKPLNIANDKVTSNKVSGILDNKLSLSQEELDNFGNSKTEFIKKPNQVNFITRPNSISGDMGARLRVIILVGMFTLLAFGVIGIYVITKYRDEIKK